ncbi:SPOR domain-containing protein [Paracoccaceae bacterium]|nr:SPOR domain-containing protein [Paracoccaceae bacterium]
MSEQAGDITSYTVDKKTTLGYLVIVGGWFVSCISLVIIGLIAYWAIKIPEKNINSLPIINAIKGDIRVEPVNPGGKSFHDEDLSIYKNLENTPKIPVKSDIILNKTDRNFVKLREVKTNELSKSDKKDLSLAIEDALNEVVNSAQEFDQLETKIVQEESLKLYLGSFDSFSKADAFKNIVKERNDPFLKASNLKIVETVEGDKKFFRVQLTNISSEEEGEKLCSILSSRQFSCLLFNE